MIGLQDKAIPRILAQAAAPLPAWLASPFKAARLAIVNCQLGKSPCTGCDFGPAVLQDVLQAPQVSAHVVVACFLQAHEHATWQHDVMCNSGW